MRIGFETIIWGRQIADLAEALDDLAAAGYQGVEFAQHPRTLGNIQQLLELLGERKLRLLGLSGGPLRERMDFCSDYYPDYLYIDGWSRDAEDALKRGFTLALHPHVFTQTHRLESAAELLNNHPELKFLPDTAHLTISRDDPVEAVRQFTSRLAAVHFKDWSPHYGRNSHRYARGFIEPGLGIVNLVGVLTALKEVNYTGWVIAEQDRSNSSPKEVAGSWARWFSLNQLTVIPRTLSAGSPTTKSRNEAVRTRPDAELLFFDELMRAIDKGAQTYYQAVADGLRRLLGCQFVKFWVFSPLQRHLNLMATSPPQPPVRCKPRLECGRNLSGDAIAAEEMVFFDLTIPEIASRFDDQVFLNWLKAPWMASLPIYNTTNAHHLRFLANFFFDTPSTPEVKEELIRLSERTVRFADALLDDLCAAATGRTSYEINQTTDQQSFLKAFRKSIQTTFGCEAVAILLVNPLTKRLEVRESTGTVWNCGRNEQFYLEGEGTTGKVWKSKEMRFTVERSPSAKSFETVESNERDECLFAPLVARNHCVVGIVRCTNKRTARSVSVSTMFTDDDAAILDAICQEAVPHLEILINQEAQLNALGRLTHEFQRPLVAIRCSVQFMREQLREQGMTPGRLFGEDYLGDIWMWTDLTGRLLDNADFYRNSFTNLPPQRARILLLRDVVAPVFAQMELLLREKEFLPEAISSRGFNEIPPLSLDKHQFQQVVFNLLANAIKYTPKQKGFQFVLEAKRKSNYYELVFRDYGIGIPDGWEEAIFDPGVRGAAAKEYDVTGQGLGLFVVRQILRAHGCSISVGKNKNPTEFVVTLPEDAVWKFPAASTLVSARP